MIKLKHSCRPFIKGSTGQVAVRVRWNDKQCEVTFITGLYAEVDKWDNDRKRAKKGTTHKVREHRATHTEINACIAEFLDAIDEVFARFSLQNSCPTATELREQVNAELGRAEDTVTEMAPHKTLLQLMDDFLMERGKERNWDYRDKEKYTQALGHLLKAMPKLSPRTLTKESMFTLRDWYVQNGYKNRTIQKQTTMLKSFLRWINSLPGYSIPQDVLDYQTNFKVVKKTVTYLKHEELVMFADYPLSTKSLELARDLWCFMAYTSLRYSDLKRLCTANIQSNCIRMLAEKTDEQLTIPLTDGALKIMKKYEADSSGLIFPVPPNQVLNNNIKAAAKEAGLDRSVVDTYYVGTQKYEKIHKFYEIISCHDARRTFVTCSLAMGISPQTVMKCTGHTGYNTMRPYIETATETQSIEMEKWNKNRYRSQIVNRLDQASEEQLKKILDKMIKLGL